MTVQRIGRKRKNGVYDYIGLSTDTKPTDCDPGSTFYELDTKKTFIWDGIETWYEV